jgi:hypothetical protein
MKKSISTQLTPENITAVLAILTQAPQQLATLSANLAAEQLLTPLGVGERSFTEDLAHLINCEACSSEAIYLALMKNEPLLPPVHPERDLGKLVRHDLFEFADLLAYFTFRRRVLLRVLNGLTEAQWARVIREEDKQRQESVYWRARGLAMHEQEHLTDLEQKLSAM